MHSLRKKTSLDVISPSSFSGILLAQLKEKEGNVKFALFSINKNCKNGKIDSLFTE